MKRAEFEKKANEGPNCGLYREALARGWVNWDTVWPNHGTFYVRMLARSAEQYEAWLCESLLTGLEHSDRLVAYRATLQAHEYTGRLSGMGVHVCAAWRDRLTEARNRGEAWIRDVLARDTFKGLRLVGKENAR